MNKLQLMLYNIIHNKWWARIIFVLSAAGIFLSWYLDNNALISVLIFALIITFNYLKLWRNNPLSKVDLHKMYSGNSKNLITLLGKSTHSIEEIKIDEKIPLKNLLIKIQNNRYALPWFISKNATELLFKADPSKTYNGLTLRVDDIQKTEDNFIEFTFSYSCYFDYIVTNWSRDEEIFHGLTVRSMLEPGPMLNSLKHSLAENHLGLSVLIVTKDGWTPLFLRSQFLADFSGQLSPSISGAANLSTFSDSESNISFINWIKHELNEEVSAGLDLNDFISINLIGISRDLIRIGKPEIFFVALIDMTKENFEKINYRDAEKKYLIDYLRFRKPANPTQLNISENISHVWINLNDFFAYNTYKLESNFKSKFFTISIDNKQYTLSESLSVNLAFLENFKYQLHN